MPTDPIVEKNKALTRRWFEEVWNQGRTDTIDELLAEDVIVHGLGDSGPAGAGRETFRRFHSAFRGALRDLHIDVADVLGEGDQIAVRLVVRGTHAGPPADGAPGRRSVQFGGICLLRWANGQVVEAWNEYDAAAYMRQIGVT